MNLFEQLTELQTSGKCEEALRLASEARKYAKDELDVYVLLDFEYSCASSVKNFGVARAALEASKRLRILKEPWMKFQLEVHEAEVLLGEGFYEQGLRQIEKLAPQLDSLTLGIELEFLRYEFHRTFGTALYQNERFEEAIRHLQRALASDLPADTRSEILSILGDCLALLGKFSEAISHLSEAEQLGAPPTFEYRLNLDLGICKREVGDLSSAKTYLRLAQSLAGSEEERDVARGLLADIEKSRMPYSPI